jgi:acyl carrier protein
MTDQDILDGLSRILGSLLGDESTVLTPRTARQDVPGWDSLVYINFIVAVESEFGVKFKLADVDSFETVGDIVQEIKALKALSVKGGF